MLHTHMFTAHCSSDFHWHQRMCTRSKNWLVTSVLLRLARLPPLQAGCGTHVAFAPRLRLRQTFSRMLGHKTVKADHILHCNIVVTSTGTIECECTRRTGLPQACHSGLLACRAAPRLQAGCGTHVAFAPRVQLRRAFSRMRWSKNSKC